MEIAAFDTHGFVKRLTGAGMPEAQAEILAEEQSRLIQERLATKQDLKKLEADLERKLKELEVTIKAIEAGLKRDLRELEDRLKRDMKELEQKLTIKLGAIMIIGVTVLATLIKLL